MPDQVTRLLLIRHGETPWNTEARIQGHIDIPLNDKGRWQAARVAQALADEELHAIYSSDLQRARHTAEAIAQAVGLPLSLDSALRERHFGRFEGMTQAEVAAQWPEEARRWRDRDPSYGPQGGETLSAFYERCLAAITRLARQHPGQSIALVAHGGVLDYLAGCLVTLLFAYCLSWGFAFIGLAAPNSEAAQAMEEQKVPRAYEMYVRDYFGAMKGEAAPPAPAATK